MGNSTLGTNNASAVIKIGIVRIIRGDDRLLMSGNRTQGLVFGVRRHIAFSGPANNSGRYGTNQTTGAIVQNNVFSGAMIYAMVSLFSLPHRLPTLMTGTVRCERHADPEQLFHRQRVLCESKLLSSDPTAVVLPSS